MEYLGNEFVREEVLAYDPETGDTREMSLADVPGDADVRGRYMVFEGALFGISPGPTGPVFFHGRERILLRQNVHNARYWHRGDENHFRLYEGDELVFSFDCGAPWFDPADSSEDRPDFFRWAAVLLAQQGFEQYMTRG